MAGCPFSCRWRTRRDRMARHRICGVQEYAGRHDPADRPRGDRRFGRRCRHLQTCPQRTERRGRCCDNKALTLIRLGRAMRGGGAPSESGPSGAITEFPIPAGHSPLRQPDGRPRRQPLVHRRIGRDRPDHAVGRHHRIPAPREL
jgi:hypothetical protein